MRAPTFPVAPSTIAEYCAFASPTGLASIPYDRAPVGVRFCCKPWSPEITWTTGDNRLLLRVVYLSGCECFDNSAFGDATSSFASSAERAEFGREFLEVSKFLFDGGEVGVGDPVDIVAGLAFLGGESDEVSYFVEGEAEFSQSPDELQPVAVFRGIRAVVSFGAGGRWHQTDLFVVPYRDDLYACCSCEFADTQ